MTKFAPEREAIVEEAVDKWMASREPLPISRAVEEAVRLTKAAGLKSIARNSITRRLEMRGGGAYQDHQVRQYRPDIPKTRRASRGGYDSEGEARLTLDEFREWLALEIAGRYHHSIHRMLGTTPAAAWADSLSGGVHPSLPADPGRFLLSFLPMVRRRLQRNGLHFERIRYWSDLLPAIAQPREPLIVRYDPRDLSCVYVLGPDRHYHSVPYADLTHPPISLGEVRHLHAMLRTQAKGRIDENELFAMHERQRELVQRPASPRSPAPGPRRNYKMDYRSRTPPTSQCIGRVTTSGD